MKDFHIVLFALLVLSTSSLNVWRSAVPISSQFSVSKATTEQIDAMNVKEWPTWSTADSTKYRTGVLSPEKIFDTNELSYIISGSVEITPEGGEPVLIQTGDFVTFPEGLVCNWLVKEVVTKHWFCYKADGSPDID
jgi:uncharacterized cupin superfamily protein